MQAPAAILSLLLVELAVGVLALTWFGPTWGKVRHGYEMLQTAAAALLLWGAWAALGTPFATVTASLDQGADIATWTSRGLAASALLTAAALAGLVARVTPSIVRAVGVAGLGTGVAALLGMAALRGVLDGTPLLAAVELALGALFLGAIWSGMILGHWYLVERRLSNEYMVWMAEANVVAVAAGAASVGLSALRSVPCSGLAGDELRACGSSLSPLLTVGNMTLWIGFGVIALVAVIAYFNVKLANEGGRSIQASTGMFYLAVILAPAAEFAAKLRFF